MNDLAIFVIEYLSRTMGVYFFRQFAVIIALFVFGALLTDALPAGKLSPVRRCAIAFPVGLSAFSVTAYAMLVIGIPYNVWTVCAVSLAEALCALYIGRKSFDAGLYRRHMIFAAAAAIAVALVATSGLAPVAISNDTMYYFGRYPDAIVHYGRLRDQFDVFMTDTGLGSVCIDTLPALFGFSESFGIRESFHISFIVYFAACVYERAKKYLEGRGVIVATVLITAVLVASTPFVLLGHWALANMYFMELFFIAAYAAVDAKGDGIGTVPVLLLALSFLRIEGTLFVLWLMICVSLYRNVARKLVYTVIIPMTLLFGAYCLKVFVQFYVLDNIYQFLTPQKAAILIGAIAATGIYLLFVFPALSKRFAKYLPYLYIFAMVAANVLMFVMNKERYITNLDVFRQNLFMQSGWGMMPYFVIAVTCLLALEYGILYIKKTGRIDGSSSFDIIMVLGFALMVLTVSYGRGDDLRAYVGDSGNRVLLQIVPLVVMMYGNLCMGLSPNFHKNC